MRKTGWICDPRFADHATGPHNPERPERIGAILDAARKAGLSDELPALEFEPADPAAIARNHPEHYVALLADCCERGEAFFMDPECPIGKRSYDVARLASGAALAAVDAVMAGQIDNAFCAVRPPGHHAEPARAMGFCYYNNVAVAARHLRECHGLDRVGILDWDVHHGNGTQASFYDDPAVAFCSLHEDPRHLYPGTGYAKERGTGPGEGATLNVPMEPNDGQDAYERAFAEQVEPFFREHKPQFLLISAGFDAHSADPLAHINLTEESFAWMTRRVLSLADEFCEGRVVSLLEGGYDLGALGRSVVAHVRALRGS